MNSLNPLIFMVPFYADCDTFALQGSLRKLAWHKRTPATQQQSKPCQPAAECQSYSAQVCNCARCVPGTCPSRPWWDALSYNLLRFCFFM